MSDTRNNAGWTSIDDGHDVPVRSSGVQKETPNSVVIGAHATNTRQKRQGGRTDTVTEVNPHMMQLSAVTGIGLVLLGAAFYFGVINLRGSISPDTQPPETGVTVTITEQNTFDPSTITVEEGGSITFENKNQNPQVLKSENPDVSLFPVQVIFKDPVSIVVDQGKAGSYTYVSETMPKDQMLTINVIAKVIAQSADTAPIEQANIPTDSGLDIPLPFDTNTQTPSALDQASISVQAVETTNAVTPTFENSSQGDEQAVISLGLGDNPPEEVAFSGTPIAVNPYTVASAKNKKATVVSDATQKKLHSGAPLESLQTHKPYRTASTGPENTWMLMIVAVMGLGFMYMRSLKTI